MVIYMPEIKFHANYPLAESSADGHCAVLIMSWMRARRAGSHTDATDAAQQFSNSPTLIYVSYYSLG